MFAEKYLRASGLDCHVLVLKLVSNSLRTFIVLSLELFPKVL
jgi:hypothetical protein